METRANPLRITCERPDILKRFKTGSQRPALLAYSPRVTADCYACAQAQAYTP